MWGGIDASLVPRELSEPREGDVEHGSVSSRARLEQNPEVEEGPPGNHAFLTQRLGHLFHLKVDERMVLVAIGMVLDNKSSSLLMAILPDEPEENQ